MLKPIGKRLLIKPIEIKHQSLFLAHQRPIQFTVHAIGDEVTKVVPGNIIYLEKHFGCELEYENEKLIVIDESSILAKIE